MVKMHMIFMVQFTSNPPFIQITSVRLPNAPFGFYLLNERNRTRDASRLVNSMQSRTK